MQMHRVSYVARHLGVEPSAVRRWLKSPTPKFPLPIAYLVDDPDKPGSPLWSSEQISELRTWLAARLNLDDPAEHWRRIDRGEVPEVHQGQTELKL